MINVVNCPYLQAGHGFVIKILLQIDIEVVDGNAMYRIGVMNIS